jgi:hypothetical protein
MLGLATSPASTAADTVAAVTSAAPRLPSSTVSGTTSVWRRMMSRAVAPPALEGAV